jgi:Protein tyrosine phosphatase-like protein, PTPLA
MKRLRQRYILTNILCHFFCHTIRFSKSDQWGAGIMILSWASVEVPRYLFYVAALVTGDATKKTPYLLFWLRYSLFALLYPTGIAGELTVFFKAASDPEFIAMFSSWATFYYATFLPIVYLFGSPIMIMNMSGNRNSAFKKRNERPPPPPRGLSWPITDPTTTPQPTRGSTETNVAIIAAAIGVVNQDKSNAVNEAKRSWRFTYWKHIRSLVEEQCKSPEIALQIADAGLKKAYELFEFIAPDGTAVTLQNAMTAKNSMAFFTGSVKGQGTSRLTKFEVPYKGTILAGQSLKDQIQKWVDYGTIEPSAGIALQNCVDHPEWIEKTIQNQYFVLLGAGSAMGPFQVLLAMGANVIAIDLDRPQIWKRLITLTKESTGSITFPLAVDPKTIDTNDEDALYNAAGCNLFTHTPMIRDWLMQLKPGKPFTIGCYAYLDGALHVQVSLAMDAICRDLSEKRPNTSLAYLCTPTDLHLIPKEVNEAQEQMFKEYSKKPYCKFFFSIQGRRNDPNDY